MEIAKYFLKLLILCLFSTSLMAMESLLIAAKNGDIPTITRAVKTQDVNGLIDFTFTMPTGKKRILKVAALHVAAYYQQEEAVKLLVNQGASVNIKSLDRYQIEPIHMAMIQTSKNENRTLQFLLECGANKDQPFFVHDLLSDNNSNQSGGEKVCPASNLTQEQKKQVSSDLEEYIKAAKQGDIVKLKGLIAKDVHLQDAKGDALFNALTEYKISCVRFLLEKTKIFIKPRHYFAAGTAARLGVDKAKELYALLKEKDPDNK